MMESLLLNLSGEQCETIQGLTVRIDPATRRVSLFDGTDVIMSNKTIPDFLHSVDVMTAEQKRQELAARASDKVNLKIAEELLAKFVEMFNTIGASHPVVDNAKSLLKWDDHKIFSEIKNHFGENNIQIMDDIECEDGCQLCERPGPTSYIISGQTTHGAKDELYVCVICAVRLRNHSLDKS